MTTETTFAHLIDDLSYRFEASFSRAQVADAVARARADLEPTSRHPEFLPVLIERAVRDDLTSRARQHGQAEAAMPEILFVCRHNEGRSQMAAALAQHLSEGQVHVRSAGTAPTGLLNPTVVDALAERGIVLDHAYPTAVTDDVLAAPDVVVTMGTDLPTSPGRRQVTWDVADPHHQDLETVRAIREDIEQRIIDLFDDMGLQISPDAVRTVPHAAPGGAERARRTSGPALPHLPRLPLHRPSHV